MFKFGDKVQIVKMDLDKYEENVYDGNDALLYEEEADMGDVGVVISDQTSVTAWVEIAFRSDNGSCVIEVNPSDLMLHSDESETVFLNNLMGLQEKCPVQKYESLEQTVRFNKDGIEVGCQDIDKADAIKIANDILTYFKAA